MSLQPSSHISERRWLQRSDDPVMDPVDAWEHGERLTGHGLDGEEVRYHEHTGTVLIRRDQTLVTVMDEQDLNTVTWMAVQHRREQE
ncbi:hypothetical protein [Haloarcula argentinensis]|uniref:RelE toxin-related domain-containing protein n=1 Tax=Haloarcula argentinensis TaxID=43776 RepID=A0ABU2EY72_HALAR|nr:hypothetical protein [Haloarcula argentinensis]MDS0253234.1 hypothetical protein [Haloarcula argentinensis]